VFRISCAARNLQMRELTALIKVMNEDREDIYI
jgi:hypothetical protein